MSNYFELPFIPERPDKPRKKGLTMVMDKGLSLKQAENIIDNSANLIDMVKLGFGTAYLANKLDAKIRLYREAGISVYLGGTLFEIFLVRGMLDEYCRMVEKLKLEMVEISDGSISIPHQEKCKHIAKMSKHFTVLSEVGSKEEGIIIHPKMWISMMKTELEAGSWKVIAEARESGTVGIFRSSGHAHTVLINRIVTEVEVDKIIWEAPHKSQQVWFIKKFGANVNIGNVSMDDIIPLETLRLGLRGDTFFDHLPADIRNKYKNT